MPYISNANLGEIADVVYAFPHGTPSTAVLPYVSMKNYNRLTAIICCDKNSTGSTCAIGVNQATAVAGTGAKALNTFTVTGIVDAASGTLGGTITAVGDTMAAVTVSAGSFTIPTTASKNAIYLLEINGKDLDATNAFDCVNVTVGNSAQATVTVIYLLRDPRFADAAPPTAILD
jgi:hypothetical protein